MQLETMDSVLIERKLIEAAIDPDAVYEWQKADEVVYLKLPLKGGGENNSVLIGYGRVQVFRDTDDGKISLYTNHNISDATHISEWWIAVRKNGEKMVIDGDLSLQELFSSLQDESFRNKFKLDEIS